MNKSMLAPIIFGLGVFLLVGFVIGTYRSVSEAIETRANKETLLARKVRAQENIARLATQYEEHKDDVERLLLLVPEDEHADRIVASIETAASQSGVQILGITLKDSTQAGTTPYMTVGIELKLAGSYKGFLSLLDSLEDSLRLYDVENISIQSNKRGTSLDINMTLRTYTSL